MTVTDRDDWLDESEEESEDDPRWEVQPRLEQDEGADGGGCAARLAVLLVTAAVTLLAWSILSLPPTA